MKTAFLKAPWQRFAQYEAQLKRQPLSPHSRRAYRSRVKHFLDFLANSDDGYADALTDAQGRDFAVRDYKSHIKRKLKATPTTVNSALTAIDHFYEFVGLGKPKVKREPLPQQAPRALSDVEERKFLKAVAACRSKRDQALALLLLHTAIRIGECAALNLDDIAMSARKGVLTVRDGKGGAYREVPLNSAAREALKNWLEERSQRFRESSVPALFLNPSGRRLSASGMDLILRKLSREAGLELSAHVLRHTCLTKLVRGGNDLVLVAEIGGHKRLETTRRYTLPTAGDKERALEGLAE